MFDYPQVMVIHCALSAQHIQNYSQGDPYIFAGDFNVKPTDSMYRLLTQGDIDEKVN
jgi:endonuclease/exonuclease/phosphatase family metal-dependent hydrolase